jgi:hypothetical protein
LLTKLKLPLAQAIAILAPKEGRKGYDPWETPMERRVVNGIRRRFLDVEPEDKPLLSLFSFTHIFIWRTSSLRSSWWIKHATDRESWWTAGSNTAGRLGLDKAAGFLKDLAYYESKAYEPESRNAWAGAHAKNCEEKQVERQYAA